MRVNSNLQKLYRGLEALYGIDSGLDPTQHLMPYRSEGEQAREYVLFREAEDGVLELALLLDDDLLTRFEAMPSELVLGDERLGDTLPVLEGLSHMLYLAEAARCERPVSGLELETQAEIDKLAMCLLGRWPRAHHSFSALVQRIYHGFDLVPNLCDELEQRYRTANRIALAFTRRLREPVATGRLFDLRRELRAFWNASMNEKRRLAA